MSSIRKTIGVLAVLAFVGGFASRADALPIVSVSPSTQDVAVGDTFDIDIFVDTDGETIGGFAFLLSFNDTKIQGSTFTNDPDDNFDNDFDLTLGSGASPYDFFFIGSPNPGTGQFRLSNVSFVAIAAGLSPLTLSNVVLSNADGTQFIEPNVENGSVCVGGDCASVPEPGLLILLTTGAAVVAVRRRRHAA